jgi:uncharacterized membrane protein
VNGIDELAAAMLLFVRRACVHERRADEQRHLRLIVPTAQAGDILTETVGHIAVYAAKDEFVTGSSLRVLDIVAPVLKAPADRVVVAQLRQRLTTSQDPNVRTRENPASV